MGYRVFTSSLTAFFTLSTFQHCRRGIAIAHWTLPTTNVRGAGETSARAGRPAIPAVIGADGLNALTPPERPQRFEAVAASRANGPVAWTIFPPTSVSTDSILRIVCSGTVR